MQGTSAPTGIRSRKSTRSMDAVTAGPPAWRIAATAAAWSTNAMSSPPKRSPRTFCMWGMTKVVIWPTEYDMGREAGEVGEVGDVEEALFLSEPSDFSDLSDFLIVHRP